MSDHNAEVQYDPIGDGNCLFEATLKAANLWTCQAKGEGALPLSICNHKYLGQQNSADCEAEQFI